MKKTVLTFGLLSGVVSALMMFANVLFIDRIGFDKGIFVGYTGIVLSLLFVYFGVRSYRDNQLGGKITFGRAFGVGMLITLISCVFYVVAWEIEYATVFADFADKYAAYAMEQARASGANEATMAAKAAEMADMKEVMDSPIKRPLFIFIEPFPVGLLVTLISAAVLRKK
ncbi:MAG: DUF4199 domain-containing protein [Vicinamibacterales bacterium]